MIVVDSSVWIDWLKDVSNSQTEKLSAAPPRELLVGDVVLLEILQGAADDRHARNLEARLRQFDVVPMFGGHIAGPAAANYRRLRGLGIAIRKTPDLIIATYCIENNHLLLQRDRDFAPMAQHLGLRLA